MKIKDMQVFETYSFDLADADTLDDFYRSQTGTNSEFIQMSAGSALLKARSVDLGDIRIVQVSGHGRHLWIDSIIGDEWRFAVMSEGTGSPRLGGFDITSDTGHLLRPGDSADFQTGGRYATVEVVFNASLAKELGWDCASEQICLLPKGTAEGFKNYADMLMKMAARADQTPEFRFSKTAWRDVIVDSVDLALSPWVQQKNGGRVALSRPARIDVIQKVRPFLRDIDFAMKTSVDDLASTAGVSKRSLFHAFKSEYGIGPNKFSEVVRLNGLRASLYRSQKAETTVTKLAGDHGFAELGRMAGKYRDLFGELPSETLGRQLHPT